MTTTPSENDLAEKDILLLIQQLAEYGRQMGTPRFVREAAGIWAVEHSGLNNALAEIDRLRATSPAVDEADENLSEIGALEEIQRKRIKGAEGSSDAGKMREALEPFAALGGQQDGFAPAYHDCPDDVVLYENSGKCITAGDVRRARIALGSLIDLKPAPASEVPTWEELLWLAQQFRAGFDNKSLRIEYAEETWEHIIRRLNTAVSLTLPASVPAPVVEREEKR